MLRHAKTEDVFSLAPSWRAMAATHAVRQRETVVRQASSFICVRRRAIYVPPLRRRTRIDIEDDNVAVVRVIAPSLEDRNTLVHGPALDTMASTRTGLSQGGTRRHARSDVTFGCESCRVLGEKWDAVHATRRQSSREVFISIAGWAVARGANASIRNRGSYPRSKGRRQTCSWSDTRPHRQRDWRCTRSAGQTRAGFARARRSARG